MAPVSEAVRSVTITPGTGNVRAFLKQIAADLATRSRRLVQALASRMELIILGWLIVFLSVAALKVAAAPTPIHSARDLADLFLPYALAAFAPIAGYRLAMAAFPGGVLPAQPSFRFALYGRWRQVDPTHARSHAAFGPYGFMASLLIGMLLNIPVRSFEFLLAVPAMNSHAPLWGTTIFHVMAFDVIAMNFLYGVCFVMALRSVPLFPRMLLFAWMMDISLQLAIAQHVSASADLPRTVALALEGLLKSNVTKVLISAGLWIPYLLLSDRVNVTYRSRTRVA